MPNPAAGERPAEIEQDVVDRVAKLSEGQLDCLRLVDQHLSSKEIAVELGISPHTVDQRIRQALQILGVDRRTQAARMVARSGKPYQRLIPQPPHIEPAAASGEQKGAVSNQIRHADRAGEARGVRAFIPSRSTGCPGLPCNRRSQRGATPGMR